MVDLQNLRGPAHRLADFLFRLARQLQRKAHVFRDRHMRIQRVALEHHRNATVSGLQVVDPYAVDQNIAVGYRFKSGDHTQHGRLAASRRPDEHRELTIRNMKIDALNDLWSFTIRLRDVAQYEFAHF
jgi:hypothetical protein